MEKHLEKEVGVTEISLMNAVRLIESLEKPTSIDLLIRNDETLVIAHWLSKVHIFNGFSWGYRGEGPRGLATFFEMLELPISLDEISSWPKHNYATYLKGEDYL